MFPGSALVSIQPAGTGWRSPHSPAAPAPEIKGGPTVRFDQNLARPGNKMRWTRGGGRDASRGHTPGSSRCRGLGSPCARAFGLEDAVPGQTARPRPASSAKPDVPEVTECWCGQGQGRGRPPGPPARFLTSSQNSNIQDQGQTSSLGREDAGAAEEGRGAGGGGPASARWALGMAGRGRWGSAAGLDSITARKAGSPWEGGGWKEI